MSNSHLPAMRKESMICRTNYQESPNPRQEGKGFVSQMKKLPKWILIGLPMLVLGCLLLYKAMLLPDGSTSLSWTTPTENENNEPLTDLAGYNIHCWAGAGQFTITIHVDDPATTSHVIENLSPGTYYCAISALNTDGRESALSNVVAKTVP